MIINRRNFLSGIGVSVIALSATSTLARTIGGGINANSEGLRAGSTSDQGKQLQSILDKASSSNQAVFIEPGKYKISNLTLPKNTRLYGTSNATIFEYAGGDHFIYSENSEHVAFLEIELIQQ